MQSKIKRVEIHNALYQALGEPVVKLIEDPDSIEVYINPDTKLWVNYASSGTHCTGMMIEPQRTKLSCEIIAGLAGKTVSQDSPDLGVEAKLKDIKCRLQITFPPLCQNHSMMIRKHSSKVYTLTDFVQQGVMSEKQKGFLLEQIRKRRNILVAGTTGVGKTTFTNALLAAVSEIHPSHRLVILEDTPELQCKAENYLSLTTIDHKDPLKVRSMQDLLKITMRESPTRIIVGEIRDSAALTLLKAWNTGHPGGISTTHADSAVDALDRMDMLIQESDAAKRGDYHKTIAKAVNVVVFLNSVDNGRGGRTRKVSELVEILGWDRKNDEYVVKNFDE